MVTNQFSFNKGSSDCDTNSVTVGDDKHGGRKRERNKLVIHGA